MGSFFCTGPIPPYLDAKNTDVAWHGMKNL